MGKKKTKISPNKSSQNILDKLIEQSFTLILTFVFATALIGGCGYLLFQFSGELHSIDRESLEYDVKANQLNSFIEMTEVALKGWLADENEKARFNEIMEKMTSDILVKDLDPVFVDRSLDWIVAALQKISLEKGKVQGFQVVGGIEQNLQRNFVEEYDFWTNYLKETDSILRHWSADTPAERDKKLESLQYLTISSLSNLSEIKSNVAQLKSQYELDKKFLEQNTKELKAKLFILQIRFSLSGTGVIIGLAIFFYVGKVALRRISVSA